jgi:hypothetical protein
MAKGIARKTLPTPIFQKSTNHPLPVVVSKAGLVGKLSSWVLRNSPPKCGKAEKNTIVRIVP